VGQIGGDRRMVAGQDHCSLQRGALRGEPFQLTDQPVVLTVTGEGRIRPLAPITAGNKITFHVAGRLRRRVVRRVCAAGLSASPPDALRGIPHGSRFSARRPLKVARGARAAARARRTRPPSSVITPGPSSTLVYRSMIDTNGASRSHRRGERRTPTRCERSGPRSGGQRRQRGRDYVGHEVKEPHRIRLTATGIDPRSSSVGYPAVARRRSAQHGTRGPEPVA
jgi:hypothetical protein